MSKRRFAGILVAGLVLGGGAVALAGGGPDRPTLVAAQAGETPPTSPAPGERRARAEALRECLREAGEDREARRTCVADAGPAVRHGLRHHRRGDGPPGLALGRAVHGTAVVPDGDGGWHEVTFDRGTVDGATDGTQIVLDRPDGQTVAVALTPDTRYHGIADAAGIVEGARALVVSQDGEALHVRQEDAHRRPGPGNKGAGSGVERD